MNEEKSSMVIVVELVRKIQNDIVSTACVKIPNPIVRQYVKMIDDAIILEFGQVKIDNNVTAADIKSIEAIHLLQIANQFLEVWLREQEWARSWEVERIGIRNNDD